MTVSQIGLSAIKAYRKALEVTTQNVANVNTPGYHRQEVVFSPIQGDKGVLVEKIERVFSEIDTVELRNSGSSFNRADAVYESASRLESLVLNEGLNISTKLSDLETAINKINVDPGVLVSRREFIDRAQDAAYAFTSIQDQLLNQTTETVQQVRLYADEIQTYANNIANLNDQILNSPSKTNYELLDKRDANIQSLSELVNIRTVEVSDSKNIVNVTLENGVALVNRNKAAEISTQIRDGDPRQVDLLVNDSIVTDKVSGGKIAGLFSFQNNILIPSFNNLGLLAAGMVDAYNEVSKLGIDLNGNKGGNIFGDINTQRLREARAIPHQTSTAVFSVNISDVNAAKASDYLLERTTNGYTLTRLLDNTVLVNDSPLPAEVDGLEITLESGTVAVGEAFTLTPFRNVSEQISVVVSDPRAIAIAYPVRVSPAVTNQGSGILDVIMLDQDNPTFSTPQQLTPPLDVTFTTSTDFEVRNSTNNQLLFSGTLTADNVLFPQGGYDPGFQLTLNGGVQAGDRFNLTFNDGATGDNRNGLALSELSSSRLFDGGLKTMHGQYAEFRNEIAQKTSFAKAEKETNEIIFEQAQSRRDSFSGVNLDEEAVRLIQFEQTFQAISQVIAVSNNVLTTLLNVMR